MSDKPQKISIGFHGGQVLSARVKPEALSGLKAALGGEGWHDLTAEDGTIALDVRRIDYLLIDQDDHRVGF
jgi:hypothetical protein